MVWDSIRALLTPDVQIFEAAPGAKSSDHRGKVFRVSSGLPGMVHGGGPGTGGKAQVSTDRKLLLRVLILGI